MKMNDSGNIFTQFFAWVAALASALGIATQDLVYMFFGAVGLIISLASFVNGRIDAHRKRREDEKRTKMLSDYLEESGDKPLQERPEAVRIAIDAFQQAGE